MYATNAYKSAMLVDQARITRVKTNFSITALSGGTFKLSVANMLYVDFR